MQQLRRLLSMIHVVQLVTFLELNDRNFAVLSIEWLAKTKSTWLIWWAMKGNNGKVKGKMKTLELKRGEKETWICQSVSDERRDRTIESKNRGDHVGLAILPTTFALSHYCHADNLKPLFKIESEIIKHDKSLL